MAQGGGVDDAVLRSDLPAAHHGAREALHRQQHGLDPGQPGHGGHAAAAHTGRGHPTVHPVAGLRDPRGLHVRHRHGHDAVRGRQDYRPADRLPGGQALGQGPDQLLHANQLPDVRGVGDGAAEFQLEAAAADPGGQRAAPREMLRSGDRRHLDLQVCRLLRGGGASLRCSVGVPWPPQQKPGGRQRRRRRGAQRDLVQASHRDRRGRHRVHRAGYVVARGVHQEAAAQRDAAGQAPAPLQRGQRRHVHHRLVLGPDAVLHGYSGLGGMDTLAVRCVWVKPPPRAALRPSQRIVE
ncbi:hypothetical protein ON010_g2333 [Phytophthora cinnamomi]|nr:hypothetical protein ON010_g2333 [Phytophthora cinnamomi]